MEILIGLAAIRLFKEDEWWAKTKAEREEFVEGVRCGIGCYAWWKNGTQWVGSGNLSKFDALKQVDEAYPVTKAKLPKEDEWIMDKAAKEGGANLRAGLPSAFEDEDWPEDDGA